MIKRKYSFNTFSSSGPCELPVEKPRVTQPVERIEEPHSKPDRGYKLAPPEDDPNVSDFENEYENKREFYHNSARGRSINSAAALSLLLTVLAVLGPLAR